MMRQDRRRQPAPGDRPRRPSASAAPLPGPAPFVVIGRRPVELLLRRDPRLIRALHILAGGDAAIERIRVEARKAGVRVASADRETLTALARSEKHQGIVAEAKEPAVTGLETLTGAVHGPGTIALALDHIQDPRNVGAIFRSAACFGVAGVIFPSRRASPVTETVVKTSAGGAYAVPLIEVPNLAGAVRVLKKAGWWIAGAAIGEGRVPSAEVLPAAPLLLVLGSEGAGIRPVVDNLLDDRFTIPQPGVPLSLNVSVAAGILLYALTVRDVPPCGGNSGRPGPSRG